MSRRSPAAVERPLLPLSARNRSYELTTLLRVAYVRLRDVRNREGVEALPVGLREGLAELDIALEVEPWA